MSKHPLYNHSGLQRNNHPQVMYALVDKRAELDGQRIVLEKELLKVRVQLESIDGSLSVFNPELKIEIKPKIPKSLKKLSFNPDDIIAL